MKWTTVIRLVHIKMFLTRPFRLVRLYWNEHQAFKRHFAAHHHMVVMKNELSGEWTEHGNLLQISDTRFWLGLKCYKVQYLRDRTEGGVMIRVHAEAWFGPEVVQPTLYAGG